MIQVSIFSSLSISDLFNVPEENQKVFSVFHFDSAPQMLDDENLLGLALQDFDFGLLFGRTAAGDAYHNFLIYIISQRSIDRHTVIKNEYSFHSEARANQYRKYVNEYPEDGAVLFRKYLLRTWERMAESEEYRKISVI